MLEVENGIADGWKLNDVIQPLPNNVGYQNCLMKHKNAQEVSQLVMMGDPVHFVLLKADFSDPANFKGVVKVICEHKLVVETVVDRSDEKRLNIKLLSNPLGAPLSFADITLYFENAPKALQAKTFIDNNRKRIIERKN